MTKAAIRRAVLLLAVIVVVAAGLIWLQGDWNGPMAPSAGMPPADPSAVDSVTWPTSDDPTVGAQVGRLDPTEVATRSELAPPMDSATRAGPLVRVHRGTPSAPVVGADVAWIERAEGWRRRAGLPDLEAVQIDEFDLPQRFGARGRTAADGSVQLPPVTQPTLVVAAMDAEFAAAIVSPGTPTVQLLLVTDEVLRLRVVDGQGEGCAGVPLAVFHGAGQPARAIWRGSTDGGGNAAVPHFQARRPEPQVGESFVAAVTLPQQHPALRRFAARPPAAEPITLVLGPTVPVEVTVVHRTGVSVRAAIEVLLRPRQTVAAELRHLAEPDFDRLFGVTPPDGAALRFPHVGLGLELEPHLRLPGDLGSWQLAPWATPASATPPLRVALSLPDDIIVLAARLLTSAGAPLGGIRVEAQVRGSSDVGVGDGFRTLADGRIDILLGERHRDAGAATTLALRATEPTGVPLEATIALGMLRRGERRDLGDVRLSLAPRFVGGVVRDDLGAPAVGVRLRIQTGPGAGAGDAWRDVPRLLATSAADGTFAFFGAAPPQSPFRVFAPRSDQHGAAATPPLAPGAEVELRVERTGVLRGKVLLPEGLEPGTAAVRLASAEVEGAQPGSADFLVDGEGGFALGGLAPGVYTATVSVRTVPDPLAVVRDVAIRPGANEDPRFLPLDLRRTLHRYRLRAVDAAGAPLDQVDGLIERLRDHGPAPAGWPTYRWEHGVVEFLAMEPMVDLVTVAAGFMRKQFSVAAGDRDVVLEAAAPVRIEIPGVRERAGTRAIRVIAVYRGEERLLRGEPVRLIASLDLGDGAPLAFSRSGPYALALELHEGAQADGRRSSVPLGTVDLPEGREGTPPVVIPIDPAQLASALQELEPRSGADAHRGR